MPLDPQASAIAKAKADAGGIGIADLDVETARGLMLQLRAQLSSGAQPAAIIQSETGAGVPIRTYRPVEPGERAPIVYLHGGGWVLGELDDFDATCRELCVRTGRTVVSVGYRLAPEHPFPAAIEDGWSAVRWIAQTEAAGRPLIVMGDSAGGGLAAVCAIRARDARLAGEPDAPQVSAQVLVYPVTDCDLERGSYQAPTGTDFATTTADMHWFWDRYQPDPARRAEPAMSPLRTPSLASLPPTLLLAAAYDPLVDEGREFAARLEAAGVPVQREVDEGSMHGFFTMTGALDAAERGMRTVVAFLRDRA